MNNNVQADRAWEQLRTLIRNEQQAKDYAQAWRKMANTSTIQRREENERKAKVRSLSRVI